MLYVDENIETKDVYDEDTNELQQLEKDPSESKELLDARAVKNLLDSRGWSVLKCNLEYDIAALTNALLSEVEMSKIVHLQEQIKSYRALLEYPKFLIKDFEVSNPTRESGQLKGNEDE